MELYRRSARVCCTQLVVLLVGVLQQLNRVECAIAVPSGGPVVVECESCRRKSITLRGFILQTVLASMGAGVSAAGGFAMFHVDDFPTSISDARLEPVATEFGDLDWDGFMFDVWHADMMALRASWGGGDLAWPPPADSLLFLFQYSG